MITTATILAIVVALTTSQDCSYKDQKGYVIDVHNSEKNGAVVMSDVNTETSESCQSACCNAEEEALEDGSITRCNLAVYHDNSRDNKSKNCFLVFCPSENSCPLTRVKNFTSSFVTETLVQETTNPEAFANIPPNPKFYLPGQPINVHKLFRRSNNDKEAETDAGDAARQTKMLLESATKLLSVKAMPAVNQENKQITAVEEKLLSEISRNALNSLEKRAKGSKKVKKHPTTPVIFVGTTSKQPQKTNTRPTSSAVKLSTLRSTTKKASTHMSPTEFPTQTTTFMKPMEETQTSTQPSTEKQETAKSIISSLLPSKLPPSANPTPFVPTGTPSKTPQPTSLPKSQGTSQHPVTLPTSTKAPPVTPQPTSLPNSQGTSQHPVTLPTSTKAPPVTPQPTSLPKSQGTSQHPVTLPTSTKALPVTPQPTSLPKSQGTSQHPVTLPTSTKARPLTPQLTSLPKSQGTSQHPATLPTSTKASPLGTSSSKVPTSSSSIANSPSTPSPSRSPAVQSTSTSTTKSLQILTSSSSSTSILQSANSKPSSSQETTQSSTLFPERDSTLSPSTKQSSPSPDSTSPSKATPSIPASVSMGNQSSPSIIMVNETNNADDLATDVDSEDGQDTAKYSASNGALIAAVCFGVIFLLAVMVVLGKHWYEAYQRRHYSKVDYLINGMYN